MGMIRVTSASRYMYMYM